LFNAGSWIWAVMAFCGHPVLLGTAVLAYSLGLRHAVDADHIAAIDNVTRKMMQAGSRPVAVGLLFSLGHSTIVLVGAAESDGCYQGCRRRNWDCRINYFSFRDRDG
jgi:high-affinity nickel-transport protein